MINNNKYYDSFCNILFLIIYNNYLNIFENSIHFIYSFFNVKSIIKYLNKSFHLNYTFLFF